jgi:hypothetical protein
MNNKLLIDNFDDIYIGILLVQTNIVIYENIDKKINKLVKSNKYISLIDLLFYTKSINKELFEKWSIQVIMEQLEKIVLYINNEAKIIENEDMRRIQKYFPKIRKPRCII